MIDQVTGDTMRASGAAIMSPTLNSSIRRSIDRRGLQNFGATLLACALVAAAMLLHAWVRTRVTEQGYRLSRLSAEYRDLSREHESLQIHAAELQSPQRVEELARTRLGMGPPAIDRVVVLVGGSVRSSMIAAAR
jgi:cell division protein FtsL